MSFPLRRDIAGVVHYEMVVSGRQDPSCWTPMCEPNTDWLLLNSRVEGWVVTCLWCAAERRLR